MDRSFLLLLVCYQLLFVRSLDLFLRTLCGLRSGLSFGFGTRTGGDGIVARVFAGALVFRAG